MNNKVVEIEKKLQQRISGKIYCREYRSSIMLEGEVENWNMVVDSGKFAAKYGYKNVVNKISVKNLNIPKITLPIIKDNRLQGKRVDVLIIGGGIIGSSIARELSKWDLSILLIEKECDLAMHSSSRNDGMVHPGIEAHLGSKKSEFNVKGNELYTKITKELDVPFKRCGSTVLFDKWYVNLGRPYLMNKAKKAGVKGISILNKNEVLKIEPNISDYFIGGVHFSTTGILSPYKMTYAFGENAAQNGVEFSFDTAALSMKSVKDEIVEVNTNRGTIYPKVVINAAGVFSDRIAEMAGDGFFTIHPRKGQTLILDHKKGSILNGVVAKPPLTIVKGNTKGGGLVKTIDGNILVGPDAYEQPYREDYSTDINNIDNLIGRHFNLINKLSRADVITYYSGIRAATYKEDFIIEKSEYVGNLVHAAGIQSPGLASAPAIALEIEKITCSLLKVRMSLRQKEKWNPRRHGIPEVRNMNFIDRVELIKKNPDYGEIVCRCEEISRGEIIDALKSPIPATTIDGIKRRVRPGMGRCQGGFCTPNVMKIIEEITGEDIANISKKGMNSKILAQEVQYENIEKNQKELRKEISQEEEISIENKGGGIGA